MSRLHVPRPVASLAAAALLALATVAPAAAADPTFGDAKAVPTFGESIDLQQPATLPGRPKRVEAVVRAGFDPRTFLAQIPNPGAGSTTLHYRYPTPLGGIYPNTRVELGFRVTFDDGRVVDSPTTRIRYEDTRFNWRTLEGKVVRVHWYRGNADFGQRALEIGDKAIENASKLLGVTETDPIDFYVYGDTDAFVDVLGPAQRENVGGVAPPGIRTLFANISPDQVNESWIKLVVPHELTHLVFETATKNPYHEPAHWLNEGLADYLAVGYTAGARANVENAARTGAIMPLRALVGRFPTTADRFGLAYDESVSAIDYLVRTYGQDKLVALVRGYAKGVSDAEAFSTALGVDDAGFEEGWLADLGVQEPVPYGPVPAPQGPLPPGWAAAPAPTPIGTGPIATPRSDGGSSGGSGDDTVATIFLAFLVGLVVLLILGLIVVARNLSRGQPLMPPLRPEQAAPDEEHLTDEEIAAAEGERGAAESEPGGAPGSSAPEDDR